MFFFHKLYYSNKHHTHKIVVMENSTKPKVTSKYSQGYTWYDDIKSGQYPEDANNDSLEVTCSYCEKEIKSGYGTDNELGGKNEICQECMFTKFIFKERYAPVPK